MRKLLPVVALIALLAVGCSSGSSTNPGYMNSTTGTSYDQYGNPLDPNGNPIGVPNQTAVLAEAPTGSSYVIYGDGNYLGYLVPAGQDQDSVCNPASQFRNPAAYSGFSVVQIMLWAGTGTPQFVGYMSDNPSLSPRYSPAAVLAAYCN